jgi:hypothetical protein
MSGEHLKVYGLDNANIGWYFLSERNCAKDTEL